jgi:hypothetical protein
MESIFGSDFRLTVSDDILNKYQILLEMDKQQIKDAYNAGQNNGCSYEYGAEEYYNETYKTKLAETVNFRRAVYWDLKTRRYT